MNLKGFGVALVLALALMITVVSCVVLATSLSLRGDDDPAAAASSGGAVRISGIGNSGNTFGGSRGSALHLARRAAAHDFVPRVSDDRLRDITLALQAQALQGDVEAAAFVFELAALQKEAAGKAAAAAAPADPPATR